tara:strand:- start:667 stop:1878 length:1212 start_codon:yes stop_codon:yes gene_type:complete
MSEQQPLSPYVFCLDIETNGIKAEYACSKLNIKHTYNKATTLTMECVGSFSADLFKLGSVVKVSGSHGFGDEVEGSPPFFPVSRGSEVLPLRFDGIVRVVRPTYNSVVITCTDMISALTTGKVQNYNAVDYVGNDLYYIAKSVFDEFNEENTSYGSTLGTYDKFGGKWFDTSLLKEGSGILATEEMNLWGLQTPKQFLDKVFNEMYVKKTIGGDLANNYTDTEYYNWKYHVPFLNKVHFYYNDTRSFNPKVTHIINEDRAGIMIGGVSAQIDTSRMVNSCTFTNSSDKTIIGSHEDVNSIAKYGKMSKSFSLNSTDAGYLQDQAYIMVERYKRPTYSYSLKTGLNFVFLPSDMVKLTAPSVSIDEVLPVEEVTFSVNNGSIETGVVLGEKQLPISEIIQRNLS